MNEMKFLHVTNKGMAFDPQSGDSYQLNEAAVMILELLQDKIEQDEIVSKISTYFMISPEEALTDVLEFKIQLKVLGLIS
jgi:hypothetical protein